jgi:Leu/Phe-tRNA-protein transferase
VDAALATDYNEDFFIAEDFSPEFFSRLMKEGFLIMSVNLSTGEIPDYVLFPKLHLQRSALFFKNLHVKKSIRRLLNRYELRPDAEFEHIIDRCVEVHGGDWLTPPLVEVIKELRNTYPFPVLTCHSGDCGHPVFNLPLSDPYPASFALYKDGQLAAGEFGVICGNVYTSYSGFYNEKNAGTVQLIHTARYLRENGFSFFDLGMPLDYKTDLGAVNINMREFVRLFRT